MATAVDHAHDPLARIVVATDFSPTASQVLERALDLARRHESEIALVHVVQPDLPTLASPEMMVVPPDYENRLSEISGEALLREAGIERCDVVVAITESDEANMVVALLAATVFHVPRLLARLRDPDHAEDFQRIARERGASYRCINPDSAAVDRIVSLLSVPGAIDVAPFMDGELLVAGFRIKEGSDLAGLLVRDMSLLFANAPTLVVAIQRGETWLVPHGEEVLAPGDIAYFAVSRSDLSDVIALVRGEPLEAPDRRRRRVIVSGATRIGLELARRLGCGHRGLPLGSRCRLCDGSGRGGEAGRTRLLAPDHPADHEAEERSGHCEHD